MKLRNEKTGEIPEKIETIAYIQWSKKIMMVYINSDGERIMKQYDSLEAFNAEWKDYEESKEYWYICSTRDYEITRVTIDEGTDFDRVQKDKEIGNYFETPEEAEKAVDKLKAWKRLKDKGFRFERWFGRWLVGGEYNDETRADLNLLFGGEE